MASKGKATSGPVPALLSLTAAVVALIRAAARDNLTVRLGLPRDHRYHVAPERATEAGPWLPQSMRPYAPLGSILSTGETDATGAPLGLTLAEAWLETVAAGLVADAKVVQAVNPDGTPKVNRTKVGDEIIESPAFIPLPSWVDACKAAQAEGLVKTDVRKTKTGRSMVAVAVTADLPTRSKANVRQVVTAPRNMAAVFTGQNTASSPEPSAALPAPTGETPQQGASDAITGKLEALMRMGMTKDAAVEFLSTIEFLSK